MARVIFTNTDPNRWMSIRTEISGTGAGDQARVMPSQSWGPPGNYPTGTEMRFWWRFEREDIDNCDAPRCGINRVSAGPRDVPIALPSPAYPEQSI